MKTTDIIHEEEMNLWEMANLPPSATNLPVIVWVSSGESVQHGPRIKICKSSKWNPSECSTIPLIGQPRIIGNTKLTSSEFQQIIKWIELNKIPLLQFWNGEIEYTQDLLDKLKPN